MIAADTNVLVRLLAEDDEDQADRAERLILAQPTFVSKTVLLEAEWVLRAVYRLEAATVRRGLVGLLGMPTIVVEDQTSVAKALAWHGQGLDFADALHLASTPSDAAFATFDRALRHGASQIAGAPEVVEPR